MKLVAKLLLLSAVATAAVACSGAKSHCGTLSTPLENYFWDESVWISAADAPVIEGRVQANTNCRAADGSSWFVREFRNDKKVVSAKWMTTGLGVYQLYVNGKQIGEEALKPGFTHYEKTKISYTYDITDVLAKSKDASNVIAAQVTPGWWADKIVTPPGHEGMIGRKCAFRSVLELCYSDGSQQVIGTDTASWKAGIAGPVKHAAIFDGEEYDAREPMGFEVADRLGTPEINAEFSGEIFPTAGAEIYYREDLAMAPVRAYLWREVEGKSEEAYGKVVIAKEFQSGEEMTIQPGDTLVVDFGQNCAGVPEFTFKADEGTVLTFLPAELLNDGNGALERGMDGPEGSTHRTNLRCPDMGMFLTYTFGADKGYVRYMPQCTFFGYRFASIVASGRVSIRNLRTIPVSSITAELETGRVETGNELVNKLISNTLWGQRSNYLSVPTDCPQRNERLGWTADTQVFSETGSFFANTDAFFHKWMRDMRDTQGEKGGFPGVAPQAQYGAEPSSMMRLGWADAGVIVPWTVWKQFGDVSIIDENWDAMVRFMAHVDSTQYDHATLIEENGDRQWADWLSYEPLESRSRAAYTKDSKGHTVPVDEAEEYWDYLGASYWAYDATLMADMAAASGRDATGYEAMAERARERIRERFLDADGRFKMDVLNTMQTPSLFLLKNRIVSGEQYGMICQRLRENFKEHDGCLQTGFLGTSILMSTLTENGMADIAYDLLFQRKNPSWLYSVDNGATTIWERWNSYTLENGMGPKGMNSFNHYAYGCVCEWIWETVCGISSDPACPGFKHIIMKPVPDKRLGWAKASYQSAAGLIQSEWKYEGDTCTWKFTIPEGATASVTLPGNPAGQATEYASGTYILVIE